MIKLREMRLSKKMKVKDIAKLLQVSEVSIYYYENGKRKPDYLVLQKLAKIFECKVDDLID